MIALDDVLSRLDHVRRTRRGWSARCPAHADRSPSLSVGVGDGGRPLLYCHAGCRYHEIIAALDIDTTATTYRITPRSPRTLALRIARQQPGDRHRLHYQCADILRIVHRARGLVTHGGDRDDVWSLLARIARIEAQALAVELALHEGVA